LPFDSEKETRRHKGQERAAAKSCSRKIIEAAAAGINPAAMPAGRSACRPATILSRHALKDDVSQQISIPIAVLDGLDEVHLRGLAGGGGGYQHEMNINPNQRAHEAPRCQAKSKRTGLR